MLLRHYREARAWLRRLIKKLNSKDIRDFVWFELALPDKELITPVIRTFFKRPSVRKMRIKISYEDILPPSTHLSTKHELNFPNAKEAIRILDKIGVEDWGFQVYCKILGIDRWHRVPWVIFVIIQKHLDEIPFDKLADFLRESKGELELWITPAQENDFKTLAESLQDNQEPPGLDPEQ